MKTRLVLFLMMVVGFWMRVHATTYTVTKGSSTTIYCTAQAPAGYITHAYFSVVNPEDSKYIAFNYNSSDCAATVYGLQPKNSIKIEVTYAYTYLGSYTDQRQIGHGTYYDYITVTDTPSPTSVSLPDSVLYLNVGQTIEWTALLSPSNSSAAFSWGTLPALGGTPFAVDITYIGPKAYITGKKEGYAYFCVLTDNNKVDICRAVISKKDPSSVSIPSSITIFKGDTLSIHSTLSPSNSYTSYTWNKTNDCVSFVKDNLIRGLQAGETDIYCTTANGKKSNLCHIIVKEYRYLHILYHDETNLFLKLEDLPNLSYDIEGTSINIVVADNHYCISLSDLKRITFTENNDTNTALSDLATDNCFYFQGNTCLIQNVETNSPIAVFDASGKILINGKTNSLGTAEINLSSLPIGTYIIVATSHSIKFQKR